jgi:hypothetical protein
MVSVQSVLGSPVASRDRRIGHLDGQSRDWSRAPLGRHTGATGATGGTRILPVLPDGTIVGLPAK